MDQGLAAVIAGGFGLAGAAIGGLAAAWGAKVGAEKTAAATRMQIADQAVIEHKQWLRQQRHEAYVVFEASWNEAFKCLRDMRQLLGDGDQAEIENGFDELRRAARTTSQAHHRVSVVGPEEVAAQTRLISGLLAAAIGIAEMWLSSSHDRPLREAGFRAAVDAASAARARYIEEIRKVLHNNPDPEAS